MSKFSKIKVSLQRMLLQFGEVETNNGVLAFIGEALEIGTEVYINDEPAPDGEYETETQIIVVAEGKVAEIREKEAPADPEPEPAPEEPVEGEEQDPAPAEEPAPAEPSLEDSLVEILKPITDEINALKESVVALQNRLSEIEEKLLQDSAKPAEEEFKQTKSNGFFRD